MNVFRFGDTIKIGSASHVVEEDRAICQRLCPQSLDAGL